MAFKMLTAHSPSPDKLALSTNDNHQSLPQVASCTLDASAKIYAGRVDAIHAETYKIMGGLGHGDKQKGIKQNYSVILFEGEKKERNRM